MEPFQDTNEIRAEWCSAGMEEEGCLSGYGEIFCGGV